MKSIRHVLIATSIVAVSLSSDAALMRQRSVIAGGGPAPSVTRFVSATFTEAEGYTTAWDHCPTGGALDSTCSGGWDDTPRAAGNIDALDNSIGIQGNNSTADGLSGFGDRILTAANHSGGGGGMGFRHYHANTVGTGGSCGGGIRVGFATGKSELYYRFYQRWLLHNGAPGFKWKGSSFVKNVYQNVNTPNFQIIGFHNGSDPVWYTHVSANAGETNVDSSRGWSDRLGDGNWHLLEVRMKTDTNGSNGILQMKADGVMVLNRSNINYGGVTFTHTVFGENSSGADAGYTDFDDIVLATDGWIGAYDAMRGY